MCLSILLIGNCVWTSVPVLLEHLSDTWSVIYLHTSSILSVGNSCHDTQNFSTSMDLLSSDNDPLGNKEWILSMQIVHVCIASFQGHYTNSEAILYENCLQPRGSTGLHIERSSVPVPLATDIFLLEACSWPCFNKCYILWFSYWIRYHLPSPESHKCFSGYWNQ